MPYVPVSDTLIASGATVRYRGRVGRVVRINVPYESYIVSIASIRKSAVWPHYGLELWRGGRGRPAARSNRTN